MARRLLSRGLPECWRFSGGNAEGETSTSSGEVGTAVTGEPASHLAVLVIIGGEVNPSEVGGLGAIAGTAVALFGTMK